MKHKFIQPIITIFLAAPFFSFCQPHILPSDKNGTYYGTWRYKNDTNPDTTYFRIAFLNDSIFAFTIGDTSDLVYNKSIAFLSFIGKKINYHGHEKWLAIMDKGGSGIYGYADFKETYPDTSRRFDLKDVVNKNFDHLTQEEFTKNIYTIYEFHFFKDSMRMTLFKDNVHERDDGELGVHYKIDNTLLSLNMIKDSYLTANYSAEIKQESIAKFLPVDDNIQGNLTNYHFNTGERVLVIDAYIKYALIAVVADNKITKFGWVLRSDLQNVQRNNNNNIMIKN